MKVEVGADRFSTDVSDPLTKALYGPKCTFSDWGIVNKALNEDSLDAVKELHEAALAYGWDFEAFHLAGEVVLRRSNPVDSHYGYADGNPARAWLIAILKALIAQTEGET